MKVKIINTTNRLELVKYVKEIENKGLRAAKEKVDGFTHNNLTLILNIPDSDIEKLTKICTFETIEEPQYQFKPFDQVLVRDDNNQKWSTDFYSHLDENHVHHCVSSHWMEVIPYNENTAHLVGTNQPYKKPEPKVWYVTNIKNGEAYEFTHDEFEHFIKTAVLNNKDVIDFNARYVNN